MNFARTESTLTPAGDFAAKVVSKPQYGELIFNGCSMRSAILFLAACFLIPSVQAHSESFRAEVQGTLEVSHTKTAEASVSISIDGSILINIETDVRFIRGVELEITAPQAWLPYRGALVMMMFNSLNLKSAEGITDFEGKRIAFEHLPSRLRIVYQIPIRAQHGLRTTTSVTVPSGVISPDSFPILFRLMPIEKGLPASFDYLKFNVTARPVLSGEGAIRLIPRYPPQQRNRPFIVLIDDNVVSNISEEIVLREGEHHLVILSDDYRNESRRFLVERAKVIDLIINLQDPTPIIIFEGPQNSSIYLNNVLVPDVREPLMAEPGTHEVKFQIGDYTIIRSLTVQRGKTYRVSLEVDLTIHEEN